MFLALVSGTVIGASTAPGTSQAWLSFLALVFGGSGGLCFGHLFLAVDGGTSRGSPQSRPLLLALGFGGSGACACVFLVFVSSRWVFPLLLVPPERGLAIIRYPSCTRTCHVAPGFRVYLGFRQAQLHSHTYSIRTV